MKSADKLKMKKEKKSKNPDFIRQDIHKKKRLDAKWRKPRGSDSKKRLRMQNRVIVSTGYKTPSSLRGHDREGLRLVLVSNVDMVSSLDSHKDAAIVSGKLGLKKKFVVIDALKKKGVKISNIKYPDEYISRKKKELEDKKVKKDKKEKTVEKKDKKSIEDKISDEDKKKAEKKEIDKLLTKRN